MTKLSTKDIARAALDAAYEMLKAEGLENEAARFAQDLRAELGAHQSTVNATLVTPSGDAGDAVIKNIQASLEKKLGRPVELAQRADKTLIGGAILEYGDARIDMSLRGALDEARQHMEHSA